MTVPFVASGPAELAEAFARATVEAARDAIAARGRFDVALTGGSAATQLYPVLASVDLPWDRIHVWFGDERAVAPTHADSNFRLAHDALLSKVGVPEAHVHRVLGELAPAEAATHYARALEDVAGVLDVVHLGLGPDGHVCSLFPGHALLGERERLVASLTDSPKPPPSRVTLTLPALAKAREVWFLAFGEAKAEAVRTALLDPKAETTAAIVQRSCNARWLLDRAAAKLL
jgi:6-phosphogluconolactonase